ncbi:MAG: nickel pincer cofactor biosynthesis protein LarC [Endomicrobiales bacterium]
MRTAYLNCSSGVAGDMILASFIDAGLSAKKLERTLKDQLKVGGWSLAPGSATRFHCPARTLRVAGEKRFESPAHMQDILKKSVLPLRVKTAALGIFDILLRAEAKAHRVSCGQAHFHELNSIDTLVDIAGACTAVRLFEIDALISSPVNIGRAAPATLEIIKSRAIPVYATEGSHEMATPTGVAILAGLATAFGKMPVLTVERTGRGAGTAEIPGCANLLQLIVGKAPRGAGRGAPLFNEDEMVLLETNIDDMDPRIYPHVMEKTFAAGAVDVWFAQVIMKKGRPGIVLSVLCPQEKEEEVAGIVFRETTTLGIRRTTCSRFVLGRKAAPGKKTAFLPGGATRVKSEFETARKKALKSGIPLKKILI